MLRWLKRKPPQRPAGPLAFLNDLDFGDDALATLSVEIGNAKLTWMQVEGQIKVLVSDGATARRLHMPIDADALAEWLFGGG